MFLQKLKPVAVGGLLAALALGGGIVGWDSRTAATAPVPPKATDDVPATVATFVKRLKAQPAPRWPKEKELGLFLMDLDKGDVTLLASAADDERAYCGSPSWSPDGKRIYFDASRGFGGFIDTRLQLLEMTDRGVTLSSLGTGNCPTASPDGKQLAYRVNGTAAGLFVTKPDGSLSYTLDRGFAKWSPDGKQLLTVSFSNPCDLSLVTAATAEDQPVKVDGHRVYSVPSWAGAGTVVALVRSEKPQRFSVALVDVTDPAKVVVKETLWKRGDGLGIEVEPMYPVYSPAQKRGVFVGREPKGQALYSFEPGKAPRRLEPQRPLEPKIASLALSPDGRYVLFCSARPEKAE